MTAEDIELTRQVASEPADQSETKRRSCIEANFLRTYGALPLSWCRAPGRVDLMGSHTDYNEGFVLTVPIDRDVWIAARPRDDRRVRVRSANLGLTTSFDLESVERATGNDWSNYIRGVAVMLLQENLPLHGFDGLIHSTVPMSSGLSSSAALECATATVFEAIGGWKIDPVAKARLCQRAENEFVGVNCGILDQYTSCAGQAGCALLLDCRDLSSRSVKLARGIQIVICDTKWKRELAGSKYGRRRAQCEEGAQKLGLRALRDIDVSEMRLRQRELPPEVARRCQFIVEENDRVLKLAEALEAGERRQISRLCAESFEGAMTLYEIGAPAMEAMMKAMLLAPGVVGARQAGAGFGGCMVAVVEEQHSKSFATAVQSSYRSSTGIEPEIYAVIAASGAEILVLSPGASERPQTAMPCVN